MKRKTIWFTENTIQLYVLDTIMQFYFLNIHLLSINGRRIFVVISSHYCCIIMNLHINKWINKHLFTNLTHTRLDWVIGVYCAFQYFVSFIATIRLIGRDQMTTILCIYPTASRDETGLYTPQKDSNPNRWYSAIPIRLE